MSFTVGSTIKVNGDFLEFVNMCQEAMGHPLADGTGVVKAVEPTKDELLQFDEINPDADGEEELIYYDEGAGRHFMMDFRTVTAVGE